MGLTPISEEPFGDAAGFRDLAPDVPCIAGRRIVEQVRMKKLPLILLLGLAQVHAGEPPEIAHGLVRAETIYPPPLEEVRYATTYNFTGHVLYPLPAVFLHKDAAAALQKVQEDLA